MYLETTCSKLEPTSVWKMGSSVLQVLNKYNNLIQRKYVKNNNF